MPVPDLACAPEEWVEVDCCVLAPLEAALPSGAVAIFPPLENGGADVSILLIVILEGYLSLPTLYICSAVSWWLGSVPRMWQKAYLVSHSRVH